MIDNLPYALRLAREQAAAVAEALIAANRIAEIPAAIRLGLTANRLPSAEISAAPKQKPGKLQPASPGFDPEVSAERFRQQLGRAALS